MHFVEDSEYGIVRIGTIESTAKTIVSILYRIITWDVVDCSEEYLTNLYKWLFTEKFLKNMKKNLDAKSKNYGKMLEKKEKTYNLKDFNIG